MKLERLFHVLVVMGGAAGCTADDDPAARQPPPDAPPGGDGDATASPGAADAGAVGAPCFCDTQVCCDRSQEPAVVAPGFTCCWSTTCP